MTFFTFVVIVALINLVLWSVTAWMYVNDNNDITLQQIFWVTVACCCPIFQLFALAFAVIFICGELKDITIFKGKYHKR